MAGTQETQGRLTQVAAKVIATLLVLPWGIFMGVMFTFDFRANESIWTWTFDIITFWAQIAAVLLGLVRPRFGVYWIAANIAVSAVLGIGFQIRSAIVSDVDHLSVLGWLSTIPAFLYMGAVYYGLPALAATILFLTDQDSKKRWKANRLLNHQHLP